jgi:hypothetical protein
MKKKLTTDEFLTRMFGIDRREDSLRVWVARYLHERLPNPCSMHEMSEAFKKTTYYGPGKGEECSADHVKRALQNTKRRVKAYNMPYEYVEHSKYFVSLKEMD